MNNKILFSIVLLILLTYPIPLSQAVGLGVSPARLEYDKILRGGYAQKPLTISAATPGNLTMFFEFNGDISDWIRIDENLTNVSVSMGSPKRVKVIIEPPIDAANGNYSGNVRIITDKLVDPETGIGSAVKAAFLVRIFVEVTGEEVLRCAGGGISISDAETGRPFTIHTTIENEGNVRISPQIIVDMWDKYQKEVLFSTTIPALTILPTEVESISRDFNHDLEEGQYWAEIRVPECGLSSILPTDIVSVGGITDKGELLRIENSRWASTGDIIPITASFKNTGPRTVVASFKGEVLLNGNVVKVIDTDKLQAAPGEVIQLQSFLRAEKKGQYLITGRVHFNDKLSVEKGSVLNVREDTDSALTINNLKIYFYSGILIVISILLMLILIKKKKHRIRKKIFSKKHH